MLEKADSLDAVVALEARLSEIRYELESYTSQLRLYDNQVDYSTVSIYMREVKDLTPTAPDSIGTRIQKGFNRSLNNLGEAVTDLIVWLAVNSPILFVLAVIIGAVVLIVRRLSRKLRGGNRSPRRFSLFRGKPMGGKKGAAELKVWCNLHGNHAGHGMNPRILDSPADDFTELPLDLHVDSGILYAVLTHVTPLLAMMPISVLPP